MDRRVAAPPGTEFGLFISFDNGGQSQPFQLNMANVPINDIQLKNQDLIIATQGRGIWILDNVLPAHECFGHRHARHRRPGGERFELAS